MKAIILVAGVGARLRPLTDETPKCLVKVNNKPILQYQLESLRRVGIQRCVLVVGYLADYIQSQVGTQFHDIQISYVENTQYHQTNNIYSLWKAREVLDEDILLVEGDLIFEAELLQKLVESQAPNMAVVDRFQPHMDGTVILGENGLAQAMILKADQGIDFDYGSAFKTVNIYKFSQATLRNILIPELSRFVTEGRTDQYYEAAIAHLITESRFQLSILEAKPIKWAEIDTVEDLAHAEELFGVPTL